jgi:hypothetical protein
MGLKLHYNPLSTFSRRVLIVFAEKQVPRTNSCCRHGGSPTSPAAVFVAQSDGWVPEKAMMVQ